MQTRAQRTAGSRALVLGLVLAMIMAAGLMLTAKPAHADTVTVNNTFDPGDGLCNSSGCTLRDAILAANNTPGVDTINFAIPGAGVKTISPTTELLPLV